MSEEKQAALSAATRRLAAEVASAEAAVAQQSRSSRKSAEAKAALAAKRTQLAVAERACETEALKLLVLSPLPTELVRLVFLLLPADVRLRCREVCRGWCAFLAEASLWRVCDLSARSGVAARRKLALLRAATERAQGTLEVLDVTGWQGLFDLQEEEEEIKAYDRLAMLLPILHSNAESLVTLRAQDCFSHGDFRYLITADIEALLAAAPRLRLLECDAGSETDTAANTLRLLDEPQFASVRLQTLYLEPQGLPFDMPAAAARIALHASLSRLRLWGVGLDSEPALGAVDNLAVSQLQYLSMLACDLSPTSLPALTRMLGSVSLKELYIENNFAPLLVGAAVPAFCAALRPSRLVQLQLSWMCLWDSQEDGLSVIAACTRHPTLRELDLQSNNLYAAPGQAKIEAALAALEASNVGLHIRC